MGHLSHFNINELIEKYQLEFFIETGTYMGDGLDFASNYPFKELHSVELIKEYYDHCIQRFRNNNKIKLYQGLSSDMLSIILKSNDIGNTLFWLDAHLPNTYISSYGNDYIENKTLLIPLEDELKSIVENKDVSNDVFIIDDLRIYENGNFTNGEWHDVINAGYYGIDFIFNLLSKTHNINKLYDAEGYIFCTPITTEIT